jgi:hypothetical protein
MGSMRSGYKKCSAGQEEAAAEIARLCKEDFTCDLKLQQDCDESVARIRTSED